MTKRGRDGRKEVSQLRSQNTTDPILEVKLLREHCHGQSGSGS